MKILRIKAENFKSYKKIDVALNNSNYIIGGNATGKSNFVNIIKFINDIICYGLDDAILLQGGIKYLFNNNSRKNSSLKLAFEVDFDKEEKALFSIFPNEKKLYLPCSLNYEIKISPNERGEGYKVSKEKIDSKFESLNKNLDTSNFVVNDSFHLILKRDSNGVLTDNLEKAVIKDEIMSLDYFKKILRRSSNLLNNFFSLFSMFYEYRSKIKIYNFDVNLLKSPSSIVARGELEENGSNLVNVLHQILKNKANKDKLTKLIKNILPFIDDIKTENNVNKSVFFKVKESFNKNEFPSYMLSDGTVNILAVIIALYFQDDSDIVIIEEPEKNIHPKLLSILVEYFSDVSDKKQIFITTHNPYIVREANLDNLILISRSNNGISTISKPSNDERIRLFLENDLGIDELFVDGILK